MATGSGRRVALVTGGSRGIGAATAVALAEAGYDVALTYRNKAARAEAVAAEVERRGGAALAVGGDLTDAEDRARLAAAVGDWRGRLDLLVLNASGGLERDLVAADPAYPMRINVEAQVGLLEAALPLLGAGDPRERQERRSHDGPAASVVVFVTSHWAHRYGAVAQVPAYEPVAASKHAGERALRDRSPGLAAAKVRLAVVTGDMVEGTITPKLLARAVAGSLGAGMGGDRPSDAPSLPTTEEMAAAIVAAALDAALPSGATLVVGRPLASLPGLAD